ncbi:hypothetical protein A2U01_0092410, partial [Trifolium medium]|nr:hypothetical protein [Trifolium medium]
VDDGAEGLNVARGRSENEGKGGDLLVTWF